MSLFTDLQAAGLPVVSATDGAQATFSRTLDDTENEIYLNLLDPTRAQRLLDTIADRESLKIQYQAAIDRLQQIENAVSPTNAQIIQAIRDIAKYERLIIKVLARLI